jgi:hypothetical protein
VRVHFVPDFKLREQAESCGQFVEKFFFRRLITPAAIAVKDIDIQSTTQSI